MRTIDVGQRATGALAAAAVALGAGWGGGCGSSEHPAEGVGQASGERRAGVFRLYGEEVELEYEWIDGHMVFEGDIVLDPEDEVVDGDGAGRATGALHATPNRRLWPDGVVPYKIGGSVTSPGRVRKAMREWEEKTAIRFVPRDGEDAFMKFVERSDNKICSAQVGYNGGRRLVYLRDTNIRRPCNRGVITHEIGHVLGLWHEHTRADRDDYVRIIWRHVGLRSAFEKKTRGVRLVGDYDIKSTMHYRSYTLSSPRDKPSIKALDGSLLLHNWATLSAGDVTNMEMLYGPAEPEPEPDAGSDAGSDAGAGADAGVADAATAPDTATDDDAITATGTTAHPANAAGDAGGSFDEAPGLDDSTVVGGCAAAGPPSGRRDPPAAPGALAAALLVLRSRTRSGRRRRNSP